MTHLRLTPEGPPLEDYHQIPVDDPAAPMTEAGLHELELGRAADEGMIEPRGPGMEVPGTEMPGPEDEPRGPGVEVPGTEVPGPEDEPGGPGVDAPGRDDRPPIVSAESPVAGLSRQVESGFAGSHLATDVVDRDPTKLDGASRLHVARRAPAVRLARGAQCM